MEWPARIVTVLSWSPDFGKNQADADVYVRFSFGPDSLRRATNSATYSVNKGTTIRRERRIRRQSCDASLPGGLLGGSRLYAFNDNQTGTADQEDVIVGCDVSPPLR
jgi:hypothetical protein